MNQYNMSGKKKNFSLVNGLTSNWKNNTTIDINVLQYTKNEVFHSRFFQQMWPKPHETAD